MPTKVYAATAHGLEGALVEVEVDILRGLPAFAVVGLTDTAIQEAKERVRSAMTNSGYPFPKSRVVVNLAPAHTPKRGPSFDLAIALGIIQEEQKKPHKLSHKIFILGELALDGTVRGVKGILPLLSYAKEQQCVGAIIPEENREEAEYVEELTLWPVRTLKEAVEVLEGERSPHARSTPTQDPGEREGEEEDFAHIQGQELPKRALEIAAAGGHNLLMVGPPGSGKTLLAKALRGILPPLHFNEALEVTKVYSVAGLLPKEKPLITKRPFRAIHHTASSIAIVGGGKIPMPGELSLAHKGVLFLDELAEFPMGVLEVLRQPLEEHCIRISRAQGSVLFPAEVQVIAATNPCPCGYYGDKEKPCSCTIAQIERYKKGLSGPFLDRMDMCIDVVRIPFRVFGTERGEGTKEIRARVKKARQLQSQRFKGTSITANSGMGPKEIEQYCVLAPEEDAYIKGVGERFQWSARGYHRLLKVARTIADLEGKAHISREALLEALHYRGKLHTTSWNTRSG